MQPVTYSVKMKRNKTLLFLEICLHIIYIPKQFVCHPGRTRDDKSVKHTDSARPVEVLVPHQPNHIRGAD